MPETGMKTKYLFLVINHGITRIMEEMAETRVATKERSGWLERRLGRQKPQICGNLTGGGAGDEERAGVSVQATRCAARMQVSDRWQWRGCLECRREVTAEVGGGGMQVVFEAMRVNDINQERRVC